MSISLDVIKLQMTDLAKQLVQRFTNAEAQIAADAVLNIYNDVRKEDEQFKKKGDDVNLSKRVLNQHVRDIIINFFDKFVVPNLNRVQLSTNMDFLNVLLINWGYIKVFAMVYKFILSKHANHYLHAQQIKQNCLSIPQMILESVKNEVLVRFDNKIISIINETFQKQRNQQNTEKEKVKELIEIIESCGLQKLSDVTPGSRNKTIEFIRYVREKNEKVINPNMTPTKFFEQNYFKRISHDCVASYKRKISLLPTQPSEYIAEIIRIMKTERQRVEYYFYDDKFKEDYLIFIEQELIDKRIVDVLSQENGIKSFIESLSEKDLRGTYSLCKRRAQFTFPFLSEQLTQYFMDYGKRIGNNYLTSDKKDAIVYIDSMIELKKKFNEIVQNYFKKDLQFTKLRNIVCKDFLRYEGDQSAGIKKQEGLGAKNLASYSNLKIKQCAKLDAADKIEEILNNIILVFQSLMSQDKYLTEHQIAMSKRLLEPISNKPNSDVERLLIRKLQQIVGPKDISKHLEMLRDYDNSLEFEKKLNDKLEGTTVRVQAFILQNDAWPDNEDVDIVFPNALLAEKEKVESIYSSYSQGKFLIWKANRGVSQLEGKFGPNTYRFTLNNMMMFILLHISQGTNKSVLFGNLKQKFKLKRVKSDDEGGSVFDGEFRLNLLSLVEHKLVLRDKGLDIVIGEGQSFTINPNYVYVNPRQQQQKKQSKLKTNVINVTLGPSSKLSKEMKVGTINTNQIVKKQRQVVLDAAIVQIMKHFKVSTYDNLFGELKNHIAFQNLQLKFTDVKQRAQNLITNDYLVRDDNDRQKLIYKP